MAEDSVLNLISSEFKLWGVRLQHRRSNGGHIELSWQVSPDKEIRRTFIPNSGSDHRGWLNMRAQVRRMFQQDGLSLKEPERPVPILHKALEMPKPVETHQDHFRAMRAEIADLTNMVIELGCIISTLVQNQVAVVTQQTTAQPEPVATPEPEPVATPEPEPVPAPAPRKNNRAIKAIDHVSDVWNSTEALAHAMGVPPAIAYHKLYHLKRQDKVELSDGRWRKKPKRSNGKANGRQHVVALAKPKQRRLASSARI